MPGRGRSWGILCDSGPCRAGIPALAGRLEALDLAALVQDCFDRKRGRV
jgi:hypothetical protein